MNNSVLEVVEIKDLGVQEYKKSKQNAKRVSFVRPGICQVFDKLIEYAFHVFGKTNEY